MSDVVRQGGCLCSGVRYTVHGELRPVVNCHCEMCRRYHGHHGAYTAAPKGKLSVVDRDQFLKWFQSSVGYKRGFCGNCGSSLFWKREDSASVSIAAGTLDSPTGLATEADIFCDDLADYYEPGKGTRRYARGLG